MNGIKLLAAILFLLAIIIAVFYFAHIVTFEQAAILLLGDIAVYPTGAATLA